MRCSHPSPRFPPAVDSGMLLTSEQITGSTCLDAGKHGTYRPVGVPPSWAGGQLWLGNTWRPLSLGVQCCAAEPHSTVQLSSFRSPCGQCYPSSAFCTVSAWPNLGSPQPSLQSPTLGTTGLIGCGVWAVLQRTAYLTTSLPSGRRVCQSLHSVRV